MDFSIGDAWGMEGLYLRFREGVLFQSNGSFGGVQPDQSKCVRYDPSKESWWQFWQDVERLGVWDWQSQYQNHQVLDGTFWHLKLQHGGRRLQTEGYNAYPGADGPECPVDCAFGQFLAALERLTGIKEI